MGVAIDMMRPDGRRYVGHKADGCSMLDFLGALGFRTVACAWRLGVFEALSAGPLTATASE